MPYGETHGFVDGRLVAESDTLSGSLQTWSASEIVFGGGGEAGGWSGAIDGVAVYDTGLDRQQVETHAELNTARIEGRSEPRQFEVIARALEITRPPGPEAIAPYRRCLVVHRYAVEQVVAGDMQDEEILVAHWGILDAQVLTDGVTEEGKTYRLRVEHFDEHPHLLSERMDMEMTAFELELYLDPIPGATGSTVVENPLQSVSTPAARR
jgi:hypothetical protein